jgi:hypothetical protein
MTGGQGSGDYRETQLIAVQSTRCKQLTSCMPICPSRLKQVTMCPW